MDNKPNINVTPLIDVLLVLLIIFMIVSPVKPTDFKAKIPQEPKNTANADANPHTLVVAINADSTLRLNSENDLGSVSDSSKLSARLTAIFRERTENRVYAEDRATRADLSEDEKIQKTVFIKAPRALDYGSVVKVVDAVKIARASPISLQIDDLN